MQKQTWLFQIQIVVLAFFMCHIQANAQNESVESEKTPEIVVKRKQLNFCDVIYMKKNLDSSVNFPFGNAVFPPGFKLPDEAKSKNPHFFLAGTKTTTIDSINNSTKDFVLKIGQVMCKPKDCNTMIEKFSDFTFQKNEDEKHYDSNPYYHYFIFQKIKFSEVYDADENDITVGCPQKTCSGILIETAEGRLFYTSIKKADQIERKLIVNGGLGSKMVDGPEINHFEKCDYDD